jgi:hypothetical protein
MAKTPTDLRAFGSKTGGPRLSRPNIDVFPNADGMIGPDEAESGNGASTFADVNKAELTGHYYKLPAGTVLPEDLDVVADGSDVRPGSIHPPTHHTIFPCRRMSVAQFVEKLRNLPWQYEGNKK